jgi:predicted acylesterase/phospholipase RssA
MSIRGVVLSAGGWRGYIHLGALAVLLKEVNPNEIVLWAGCSIGALIAWLMVLGISPDQIMEYLLEHGEPKFTPTFNITSLLTNFGLIDMEQFAKAIEELVVWCKVDKDHLRWSFYDTLHNTGKHLMVCTVNLDRSRAEYFSPITTPEASCMEAVLASCCVPGIFQARKINGCVHIDGGRLDRFPKTKAKEYLGWLVEDLESVLFGVMLQKSDVGPVTNIATFIYKILTVGSVPEQSDDPNVLFIDDGGTTDPEELYTIGMRGCQRYFL